MVSLPPKPVAPGPNASPEERLNYQEQMQEYWFAVNNAQQTITQTENAKSNGCCRFVYNRFLAERTAAFQRGGRMNYVQTSAALTKLKADPQYAWLREVSNVPLQQSLQHLQTAFRNFFEKRAEYPSFKRKKGRQAAEYTRSAFRFEVGNQRLTLSGLGRLINQALKYPDLRKLRTGV